MSLGVRSDRRSERRGVDAERVARREQYVVEAVAVGGANDVRAVLPGTGERRVGDAEELVVVVAQCAEPRDLGDVGSVDGAHGSGTPSEAWMIEYTSWRDSSTPRAAAEPVMRSGVCEPMMATGADRVGEHEGDGDRRAIDALAFGQRVDHLEQFGANTLAGGEAAAAERAPGHRHGAGAHAGVERAVAQRIEVHRGVLGLVGGDRERQVGGKRFDLGWRVVRDADLADLALVA